MRLPWFRSLRAQLLGTYLFLVVISLGVFVTRVGTSLDSSRFAGIVRDQEAHAILIASATEELLEKLKAGEIDLATLQQEVASLAQQTGEHMVIFDARGQVLADTQSADDPSNELPPDISTEKELAAALQGDIAHEIRYDLEEQSNTLYTAAPIHHDKNLVGVARLELPMSEIANSNQRRWMGLIGAALVVALATALVSAWFARTLARPISDITQAASAMSSGNLKQQIPIRSPEELAELARSFNRMAERLARIMEDQRAFVANAAHELRTPLTSIRLRTEALKEGAKDDPVASVQFLTDIESETERLAHLTDELLDLAKIETGLVESKREWISVKTLILNVVREWRDRAERAGLVLSSATEENLPSTLANPSQLRQVLVNVIANACKFTPPGGSIVVKGTLVKHTGSVSQTPRGWIRISVQDTGIGIDEQDLPRIFDRFYRSDKARARESGGAGLGLAIVKGIVLNHGGQIWAQSQKDKGTTITFDLPISPDGDFLHPTENQVGCRTRPSSSG